MKIDHLMFRFFFWFARVEVGLRIGNHVEIEDMAVWSGVADLNTNSAARGLDKMVVTLWA